MNKILESLYDDPGYTITELANIMKMSRKSISNNIKKLKDLGIIERVGNNKKGYWKSKTVFYIVGGSMTALVFFWWILSDGDMTLFVQALSYCEYIKYKKITSKECKDC